MPLVGKFFLEFVDEFAFVVEEENILAVSGCGFGAVVVLREELQLFFLAGQ